MFICFGMIWNCDNFSRWNSNMAKSIHFRKFIFIQNWLEKKWHIGAPLDTINKKFQKVSFENSSSWKHVFLTKGPQKDNSLKCKVNTLAR
jgi:hypothetical protein